VAQQGIEGINPQRGPVHREAGKPWAVGVTIDQATSVMLQMQAPLQSVTLQPQIQQPIGMSSRRDRAQELLDLMGEDGSGAIAI
jgi:hypothetical protein